MRDRFQNILTHLTKKDCITKFVEDGENNFEVTTIYAAFDMLTWLKFEVTGDILRVRFTHLCASLEVEHGVDPSDLLRILMANRYSYNYTSAYFSVNHLGDFFWVYLENTHFYLLKWSDEDIADAISIQFLDLNGIGIGEPPEPIKMFRRKH